MGAMSVIGARAQAAAGIAGPAAFTAAWIVSSLRQAGHAPTEIQLSGLAAPDARDPWIMIAGFVALGGCTIAFGQALHDALGGAARPGARGGGAGPAPRLIQATGALTIADGLLRRDHMLLTAGGASWHSHAHDVISAVIYVNLVVVPNLLAARFGREPPGRGSWRRWRTLLVGGAAVTAATLAAFGTDISGPGAGILQRVAVTTPLAVLAAIAARLVTAPAARCAPPG
jgi:hypothetical protein